MDYTLIINLVYLNLSSIFCSLIVIAGKISILGQCKHLSLEIERRDFLKDFLKILAISDLFSHKFWLYQKRIFSQP